MRLTAKKSRHSRRVRAAAIALPLSLALAVPVAPSAGAQAGSSRPPGSGTDYLLPGNPPPRTPINTTDQNLPGLPAGVDVEKVEWITDRWANVYIKSAAMPGNPVKVQILLARDWYSQPNKSFPTVWALDGLRARDDESGWTLATNIAAFYADKNVNVVLPVGGQSSFYSDWQQPDNGKFYKWETFLTRELPPILAKGWRSTDQRAIIGLSMGGTAAVNIAERHPEMFQFVGSLSGYLDTTSPGMPQAIGYATNDGGGYDAQKMWGPYGTQDWVDHDPKLGIEQLKGKTVYVSSGNGNAGAYDAPGVLPGVPANTTGMGLEIVSRLTTQTFVNRAQGKGLNLVTAFRPSGTHNWPYWQFEMTQAWPHIADTFKLAPEDRGATCVAGGAIGARAGQFRDQIGECISPEYDGAPNKTRNEPGKIQDFRGGRAYWSPATDAHFLWGRIGARYSELGATTSWLGYPKGEEVSVAGGRGRFVEFENGNIYWTPQTGAVDVNKDIMAKWGETGYENGPLGFPTAPEKAVEGGAVQEFENGVIVRKNGAPGQPAQLNFVQGLIAKKYMEVGGPTSPLGFPTTGELSINGGKFSRFEKGSIYWSAPSGAHFILNGPIYEAWGKEQWENGRFGYPTSDQAGIPGGEEVQFQHGKIRFVNNQIQLDPPR